MASGTELYVFITLVVDFTSESFGGAIIDGPVLTQTELYLLGTELHLNPILTHGNKDFHLVFNIQTGTYLFFVMSSPW